MKRLIPVLLLITMLAACAAPTPVTNTVVVTQQVQVPVTQVVTQQVVVTQMVQAPTQPPATAVPTAAKPYAGKTLTILNTEAVPVLGYFHQYMDPRFEEATGVHINYQNNPHGDLFVKLQTQAASKADTYDVFMVDDTITAALDVMGGVTDLLPFYKADPGNIDLTDFPLRTFGAQALVNGKFIAVPTMGALGILSYRKDLFNDPTEQANYKAKYGTDLKPPTTWQEYLQIGQFFDRPSKGLYGFSHRYGVPNQIEFDWVIGFFYSRGGSFFDANFNPTIDTPEAKESLAFFLDPKLSAVEPPGYQQNQFANVMQNMVQCKTAMYMTESWSIPLLMDRANPCGGPDKIGIAPIPGWQDPSGTIHRGSLLAGTGWSINNNITDEQKKIAWEYIKFTTDNARVHDFAAQYGYAPLNSVFRDPTLDAEYPWLPILDQMSQVATPRCTAPFEIQLENAIGTEFQKALAGSETTDQALANATTQWKTIVHQAGYDDGKHHFNSATDIENEACKFFSDNGIKDAQCP